jgi:hypothetical protein
MEQILVSILTLFPAVFVISLMVRDMIVVSTWAYNHLCTAFSDKSPAGATEPYRNERSSGRNPCHSLTEKSDSHTYVFA